MALFTDSDIVTLDDLLQFEGALVQISSTHGIDVETKIRLAIDEIGDRMLLSFLQAGSTARWSGAKELALVNIVVSPPLYRWICFNSLARVYAEAYNVQLNTRFQGKWTEYQQQANQASNLVMASGIGVVVDPLPKPGLPNITVSQGSITAPAVFAQVSWTGSQGQESAPGPVAGAILNGANAVQIGITELGADIPANVSGWNIYAGTSQGSLTLQTEDPLGLGQPWQMPPSGVGNGRRPGTGQRPDFTVTLSKQIQRG